VDGDPVQLFPNVDSSSVGRTASGCTGFSIFLPPSGFVCALRFSKAKAKAMQKAMEKAWKRGNLEYHDIVQACQRQVC